MIGSEFSLADLPAELDCTLLLPFNTSQIVTHLCFTIYESTVLVTVSVFMVVKLVFSLHMDIPQ